VYVRSVLLAAGLLLAAAASAQARGGGGCFLPDTPILFPDGTEKKIGEVRPGDSVLAFHENGAVAAVTVKSLLTSSAGAHFAIATDRAELRATGEHPFYTGNGTYKAVEALSSGDTVYAFDGRGLSPRKIRKIARIDGTVRVCNLQVDPPSTFFAAGIAVHNKGGGGGGGGSRSSSGSSRSSGSSGGSSGGGTAGLVVFFLVFGVFFFAIFYAAVSAARGKGEELDFLFGRRDIERKSARTGKILTFLSRQDASADPAALEKRIREVFLKLQECWMKRDYGPMEPMMIPFLYKEHCRQLAGMTANHEINLLEGLSVRGIDLIHVHWANDPERRQVTALITAEARDYYKDDRTGKFLRGDKAKATFQEFWTFQRRAGEWLLLAIEQTKESGLLRREDAVEAFTDLQMEGIAGSPEGATGPSGPAETREVGEKAEKIERMLNFLVQTDRLWDRGRMLEAARQGFTDLYLSREAGGLSPDAESRMFPDAAKDFKAALAGQKEEGLSAEYRNFCVRRVELALVRNFSDNRRDEFLAHVFAHAQRIVKRRGTIVHEDDDVVPFDEYLTFGREAGTWKLKEAVPAGEGAEGAARENVDEDASLGMLRWYYTKKRAV
jgi:predicted lipid-binding transport protein (Tim44 family)